MHITGWHIDGFGVFSDYRIEGLDRRPVIVHGSNEAGKSTLLAFLQGVLFDFPKGRKDRKFPPLAGGNPGGRVFLETDAGPVTVERSPASRRGSATVILPDGSPLGPTGDEQTLKTILGHTDAAVFRSVFAFSLTELQTFDSLNAEGVREQLFSAGIAGAGKTATSALRDVDGRAEEILKPRSGPLRDIQHEIKRLERKLSEERTKLSGHAVIIQDEEAAIAQAEQARQRAEDAERRRRRADLLKRLWPLQVAITDARSALDQGEDAAIDLLAFGEEIGELQRALDTHRQTLAELAGRERDVAATVDSLAPDDTFEQHRDSILEVVNQRQAMRAALEQMAALKADREDNQRVLDETLARLGPEWTVQRIGESLPTVADRDAIQAARQHLEAAAKAHTRVSDAVDAATETVADARDAQEKAEKAVAALPAAPTRAALEDQSRRLRQARHALSRRATCQQALDTARSQLEQVEREADTLGPPPSALAAGLPWLSLAGLIIATIVFGYGAGFLTPETETDLAMATVAGFCLAAALLLLAWIPAKRRAHRDFQRRWEATAQALDQANSAHDNARAAWSQADRAAREALDEAGLPADPASDADQDLEHADTALQDAGTARHALERAEERRHEVNDRLKREYDRYKGLLENRDAAASEENAAREKWQDHLTALGLPTSLSPDGVTDALGLIDQAADRAAIVNRSDQRLQGLSGQIDAWHQSVHRLAAVLGTTPMPHTAADGLSLCDILAERLSEDDNRAARRAAQVENLERLRGEIRDSRAKAKVVVDRLKSLASDAGLNDIDALLPAVESARNRAALRDTMKRNQSQLREQVGGGSEADAILQELARGSLEDWATAEQSAATEVAEAREEMESAQSRAVELRTRRRELEASADIPATETELAGLRQSFDEGLTDWRVLSLASHLIRQTLQDYQRSRQPAVLRSASGHFNRVTGGRYRRVAQDPASEDGILVEAAEGSLVSPGNLSRGTVEQLYLSMRLGLADDYGERRVRLPLIVDDVLVNFDPDRARRMAEAFLDLAPAHQVMVFTCHPWVIETFQTLASNIRVIDLPAPAKGEDQKSVEPDLAG